MKKNSFLLFMLLITSHLCFSQGPYILGQNGVFSKNSNPVMLIDPKPTLPAGFTGAGTRFMWIPSMSAIRMGTVDGTQWDTANIGHFSLAQGHNAIASGAWSTSIGFYTTASGTQATAIGTNSTASGPYSFAVGSGTVASGSFSHAIGGSFGAGAKALGLYSIVIGGGTSNGESAIAIGDGTVANGKKSLAIGKGSTASGEASFAVGEGAIASGTNSIAIGFIGLTASGNNSIAMGTKMNTNGKIGSFMIGDSDPLSQGNTVIGAEDQFAARFRNGYYLITSGDNPRTGVVAGPGANSWSAISDSTKKERFLAINGNEILNKISKLNLTTWNYRGQDPSTFRHYGPMAQDFFNAFGHDKLGSIGCDTLINQQDFLGVSFVAIQALVKRNDELKIKVEKLEAKLNSFQKLEARLEDLEKMLVEKNGN
jgi:hypothetical protein